MAQKSLISLSKHIFGHLRKSTWWPWFFLIHHYQLWTIVFISKHAGFCYFVGKISTTNFNFLFRFNKLLRQIHSSSPLFSVTSFWHCILQQVYFWRRSTHRHFWNSKSRSIVADYFLHIYSILRLPEIIKVLSLKSVYSSSSIELLS